MTLSWLSNNMSADYEDVHIPVKKIKPKQTKVVTFWCAELCYLNILPNPSVFSLSSVSGI